eukprot:gnl/Dysnectes_brevis/2637_a3188_1176.p1 GENE.gnl/Dysnectes_brevis/2637_a3188_1176~~gnl/Dysnectes_brevis/2637_a3188_1176.p1  ORF type:complete len:261 (+),score=-2.67 gnl/Dysnectes_brevis/2637_a3188_1176:151-933(+)
MQTCFTSEQTELSPLFEIGKHWTLQVLNLAANDSYQLPTDAIVYVKVIRGSITDHVSPQPLSVESGRYCRSHIIAEDEGATLAIFTSTTTADITTLEPVIDLPNVRLDSNPLDWVHCNTIYPPHFKNAIFYNLKGLSLTFNGEPLTFIQFWAAGPNVNCGEHDHSELSPPGFCETHFCLHQSHPDSGMRYRPGDSGTGLVTVPLPVGCEHGAFWHLDSDGHPLLVDGVVSYPPHLWQAGDARPDGSLDIWCVFETLPAYQ